MPRFAEADHRLFVNVYVCRRCNATQRGGGNAPPPRCRKCGSKRLRPKNKAKKS